MSRPQVIDLLSMKVLIIDTHMLYLPLYSDLVGFMFIIG